jgi:hypothetical protein
MKIWRCPSGTSLLSIVVGVYWIINCSWTSLPLIDMNVLIHWLSFFEPYCPQFIDSSFDHLYPPADLNTVCFPSRRSIVLPTGVSWRIDVISVRNLQTWSMFFLFENLSYFGIKSHISKVMSIQVWLLKWNQRDVNFWKYFLEIKLYWSKIQHTLFNIVLWLSCILREKKLTRCKIKMVFPWFFVAILNSNFGYIFWLSVMRWPFMNLWKNKVPESKLEALSRKIVSFS